MTLLTPDHLTFANDKLAVFGDGHPDITMLAIADLGNGYALLYGVIATDSNWAPFTMRAATPATRAMVWTDLAQEDPGASIIAAAELLGDIVGGDVADPHQ